MEAETKIKRNNHKKTKKNKRHATHADMELLTNEFKENKCDDPNNFYNAKCNDLLFAKESVEAEIFQEEPVETNAFLYPNLSDPNFNVKIAKKKEFNDTKYDGTIYNEETVDKDGNKYGVKEHANAMSNAVFELSPHQAFVKNFLSFQTPYNSLLLFHGLGSGKTCSAIGVCEESREYLKQIGISKRIIIVASPNVLDNFKLQLFDERKLVEEDGIWTINSSCIGSKLLNELNPTNLKGLTRERVISQVKNLINTSYLFLGYIELSRYIQSTIDRSKLKTPNSIRKHLQNEFNDRLIVIDEVHNIRMADENENKKVAEKLLELVSNADNLRLLLLSATPMFNNCKEIVWLLNLMNINDRRAMINMSQVFDKNGDFKEGGQEVLVRKSRGYISYVRGENPYTFPFRIFPKDFLLDYTPFNYPDIQMNKKPILPESKIKYLDLFVKPIGEYQMMGYEYIMKVLETQKIVVTTEKGERQMPAFSDLETINYTLLQVPLQSLNIIYPIEGIESGTLNVTSDNLTGSEGLRRIMDYTSEKKNFKYKQQTPYGRIFARDEIGKYSSKIKNICDSIQTSEGVILIYSQYLDGGLIPMALALEEMGFSKADGSLFETPPSPPVDANHPAKYIMITGDLNISPNNDNAVKELTNMNNIAGHNIKVVLISKAGSEGIDLKFIRQVHIMEPWYNMNRVEQIIGRAVRNGSHKDLPFEHRNVEIFLHGTSLPNNDTEAADIYVYRTAEEKAIQIGKVSRLLKENAVDCIINHDQTLFTQENFDESVEQILSNGKVLPDFHIGDVDYSSTCDYMECNYECGSNETISKENLVLNTYSEQFILVNSERIIQIIKNAMKERHFYKKITLLQEINRVKSYPIEQIYAALTQIIDNKEHIYDKYNHLGFLINIGDYYLFQPTELTNKNASILERSMPLDVKHDIIQLDLDQFVDKVAEDQQPVQLGQIETKGKEVLKSISTQYASILKKSEGEELTSWFKLCRNCLKRLIQLYSKEVVTPVIFIEHFVDVLLFEDKIHLLNYLYSTNIFDENPNTVEGIVHKYIQSQILTSGRYSFIVLFDKSDRKIMKLNTETKTWVLADEYDNTQILPKLLDNKYRSQASNYNQYVGFMEYNNHNTEIVFKLKNIDQPRNKGARCSEAQKKNVLAIINQFIGDETYFTKENTKNITLIELCIFQEFILRLYDQQKKNGKTWFLSLEESRLVNF